MKLLIADQISYGLFAISSIAVGTLIAIALVCLIYKYREPILMKIFKK